MARRKLQFYLEDFTRLSDLTFVELDTWIKEEPYCQNLHLLYARKLTQEGITDNTEALYRSSSYAIDRYKLYTVLYPEEAKFNISEEVSKPANTGVARSTENKRSSKVAQVQEALTETKEVKKEEGENLNYKVIDVQKKKKKTKTKKKDKNGKETKSSKTRAKGKNSGRKGDKKKLRNAKPTAPAKSKKKRKVKSKTIKSSKSSSTPISIDSSARDYRLETDNLSAYSQWLLDLRTEGGKYDIPYQDWSMKTKKKKKSKKAPKGVKESIRRSEDIISQSLAELLAKQGKVKRAIKMYERLSLKIPEKRDFFASRIKKLKKSL